MASEVTKTYVELNYPGTFFAEDEQKQVTNRCPMDDSFHHPKAFSLQYYDQVSTKVTVDGKTQTVYGDRKNLSPVYFPDGELFTLKQIKALGKDYDILASNMEFNDWPIVVKTRVGNFQPFTKDCELI